jgi:parvulin-like peptidyl-prolyl isomerase
MAKQSSTPKVVTKKHIARLERERRQTRLIVGIAITGIVAVLGLLTYGYLKLNVLQQREPVAEVNSVRITTVQWQERVRFQRAQMINIYNQYAFYQQSFGFDYSQQMGEVQAMLQQPEIVGQQALDQLRDEILIKQEAEKRGIKVSQEEIDALFKENFGFFPDGSPTPTITPTEFAYPTLSSQQLTLYPATSTPTEMPTFTPEPTATLDPAASTTPTATAAAATPTPVPQLPTASPTPYTLEGFQTEYKDMLENYKTYDISEKTIHAVYESELLRRKLVDDLAKDLSRSEEQVWVRHILVETEVEAEAIHRMITEQGMDFAELAKKYSKDTGSGANGGDMGWHTHGYYVKEFGDAAYSQEIGEIGQPVKTEFGYHIIQVLDRQELPLTPSQREEEKQRLFSDWLTLAREEATVETFEIWKERVPTEPVLQTQLPQ